MTAKIARFDCGRFRPADPHPIRPGESLYKFLDRSTMHGCDTARRHWNACLSTLPNHLADNFATRLTRTRSNSQAHQTFIEIATLHALTTANIYAIPIAGDQQADIAVPSSLGTLFLEIKSKWISKEQQHAEDQLYELLHRCARHVRDKTIRLDVHEYDCSPGSPSARSLASFLNQLQSTSSHTRLQYPNTFQWHDSNSGATMTFSILHIDGDDNRTTIQGIDPCVGDWNTGGQKLESVIDFVKEQHSTKHYVIPAVAWRDDLHSPSRAEIHKVAKTHTKYGLIWIAGGYPWSPTGLELFPGPKAPAEPIDRLIRQSS